jgi:MoxR-like ATPase
LLLGASPRAAIALLQGAKALAALDGRAYVVPDDVKALAAPVLRHRLIVRPEAELAGISAEVVIGRVLGSVPVPR